MLSDEALVLFAATGACALLILGVLELVTPSRRRVRRRTGPGRDPWRRARTGPPPVRPHAAGPIELAPEAEPPIERLLLSEAATLAPSGPQPGPIVPRLPPPREPTGLEFPSRRPILPSAPTPPPQPPVVTEPPGADARLIVPVVPDEALTAPGVSAVIEPAEPTAPEPDPLGSVVPEMLPDVDVEDEAAPTAEEDRPTPSRSDAGRDAAIRGKDTASGWDGPGPGVRASTRELGAPVIDGESRVPGPLEARAPGFAARESRGDLGAAAGVVPAGVAANAQRVERARTGPSAVVDRCYALYEARHYTEALAEAVPALENVGRGGLFLGARDAARLWGLAGLARQALGEHEGARSAFEEAIAAAPAGERATWQRHLGMLALHVGERLLAQARTATTDAESRIATLRAAITWLEAGRSASPNDVGLRDAVANAQVTLWPTYEQACGELIHRQDYELARRLLGQALGDPACPVPAQTTLRDLLGMTYGGEVGQLTAEAIRYMQEGKEEDSVVTLDRAEALLATIPDGGVTDKRRQELERRLWWSYTKVGMRRLDGGMYEEALGPLLHALHFGSVGPERLEETRRPLARALESLAEIRSPLIQRLAADGDRDGALALCERLLTFLRTALERGLTREELGGALDRTQALFEKLGKPRR